MSVDHLASYHVYSQIYSHWNVKNGSLIAFSADDSKTSVTTWGTYLRAYERSYLALLEDAKDYWIQSYH